MFRVRAVKSRLSHILSFYLQAMTTYLESLLSENATAGPGAHKMDLCDCAALELQEAFDSDKEYKLGLFFGVAESLLRNMGREDLIIDSQSPPPPPPASTAKRPKKMEQKEEAKDKKKQREEEDLKMKTSKRRPAPKKTWPA